MKGLSLVGHEMVTHGFGVRSGDCGGDTDDGSGDCRRPAQQSMDDWEEPGEVSCGLLFFLLWSTVLLIGMFRDWPDWVKGGRKDCVSLWVFHGTLGF